MHENDKSNDTDSANIIVKCCKISVLKNTCDETITKRQYTRIKIVDWICENPAFNNLWWRWFLSAENGLFPEIPLIINTLNVSIKGNANKANIKTGLLDITSIELNFVERIIVANTAKM